MSAIETTTDMATFEGALDECYCHLFPRTSRGLALSWCGVPRSEQPPHGVFAPCGSRGAACESCGRPHCPECLRRSYEEAL